MPVDPADTDPPARTRSVDHILRGAPLVDGHNDVAWAVTKATGEPPDPGAYPFGGDAPGHTDLPRLREGRVGAQFWAVYAPCERAGPGAARAALQQFEVVRRIEADHGEDLEPCWSAWEVEAAVEEGRIASLIGVEGGHLLEGSLDVLRAYRRLGARYLTLTHNCAHDWADSATDEPRHGGLAPFGREVVRELNRLGMLVDLSHASREVMEDVLEVSEAPVVFTHSSARALCDHPRNVPNPILERVGGSGGVVMVTFVPRFVSEAVRVWEEAGDGKGGPAENEEGEDAPSSEEAPRATLAQVADHVEHVRDVAGVDHVGIGGDFDGTATLPEGLEDVSRYPALFEELARRGWTDDELMALAGRNVLRVMRDAERVAEKP